MIKLNEYIIEKLSDASIKKLEKYIDDNNVEQFIPYIIKGAKTIQTTGVHYKDYFKDKGLSNKDFNNSPNLGHRIADIFNDNDATELFNKIIINKGLLNYTDIINTDNVLNIYDLIQKEVKSQLKYDISDKQLNNIIDSIANINNVVSNNANVGKYEVLLKFLLKQNTGKETSKGDVVITYEFSDEPIEVKTGNNLQTSAHPCGQTVKSNLEITKYFAELYDIKVDNNTVLFGGAKSSSKILDFIGGKITDVDDFIKNIVKTIAYQYFLESNNKLIDELSKAVSSWNKIITETSIDEKEFNQLIGCLQTYCYYVHDKWNALCVFNTTNGNFRLEQFSDDITKSTIENIMKKFSFYPSEGNKNATGRRSIVRIFIK